MDFLPIISMGKRVYAGFWLRLGAGLVDVLVLVPLVFLFIWLGGIDRTVAIVVAIPSSILFAMYSVFFHGRFGGTLGKLAVGIRVARLDGSRIGWAEAWKRSSVDIAFAFVGLVVEVRALIHVDPSSFASSSWFEQAELLRQHVPAWYLAVVVLGQVWVWSEVVVLLFNERKRSIHDFIAGTVVIRKEFADSGVTAGGGEPYRRRRTS